MARPVNANAEQTKRRILQAASELFADHGFDGTSVRQIAGGAGVSLGMIRHYFGSKEGLYRACIASAYEIYQHLGMQIRDGVRRGGNPAEVVEEAVRTGFKFALDNRASYKLTLWSLMDSDTWRNELTDQAMLPFIVDVARAIAEVTGEPIGELAFRVRTMIFLVSRYATADLDEMAILQHQGEMDARASAMTLEGIEEHLANVARRLFS
jgi:AcrR family transcriptional regulator